MRTACGCHRLKALTGPADHVRHEPQRHLPIWVISFLTSVPRARACGPTCGRTSRGRAATRPAFEGWIYHFVAPARCAGLPRGTTAAPGVFTRGPAPQLRSDRSAGESAAALSPPAALRLSLGNRSSLVLAIGVARVAEPGADGQEAPAIDVLHPRPLAQPLHHRVVVQEDRRV